MLELQKKHHDAKMERDKELYERQIKVVDTQIMSMSLVQRKVLKPTFLPSWGSAPSRALPVPPQAQEGLTRKPCKGLVKTLTNNLS